MTGHRCLVTRNPTADTEHTRGHGLAWMITCPVCVRASQYAAQKHDQYWIGTGERYAADYGTALAIAHHHEQEPP